MLNSFVSVLDSGGAGGGGGAYESIATATGTGSSATITFSSIPSTYKHLQIRGIMKSTSALNQNTAEFTIALNSDTGSNYAVHRLTGDGATVAASGGASTNYPSLNLSVPRSDGSTPNTMGTLVLDLHDYASTTKNKTLRMFSGADQNGTGTYGLGLFSSLWINTSAVTSLSLTVASGNWTTSTVFSLYGIKGA